MIIYIMKTKLFLYLFFIVFSFFNISAVAQEDKGQRVQLYHNGKVTQDGLTKEILRFNADGTIQAVLQNGETITVTNDEAGLQQVREAVLNEQNLWALR